MEFHLSHRRISWVETLGQYWPFWKNCARFHNNKLETWPNPIWLGWVKWVEQVVWVWPKNLVRIDWVTEFSRLLCWCWISDFNTVMVWKNKRLKCFTETSEQEVQVFYRDFWAILTAYMTVAMRNLPFKAHREMSLFIAKLSVADWRQLKKDMTVVLE